MEKFPVIDKGEVQVEGKKYRYEVRKLHNDLGANYLVAWNEKNEQATSVIFEDQTAEKMIKILKGSRDW